MPDTVTETAAAIALHFGMIPERQYSKLEDLYKAAALGAVAFQEAVAEEVSWGDEADIHQTLHNFAARILEFMAKERKMPGLEHLRTLAKESIYYFMEPKFAAPLSKDELHLIRDVLVSGMEGGINHWAAVGEPSYPPGTKKKDFSQGGKMQPKNPDGSENYYHWAELLPTTPGGAVMVIDQEEETSHRLDLPALQKAWNRIQLEYPKVYQDILDENYDANTGDLLIQLAVLGEHVYG